MKKIKHVIFVVVASCSLGIDSSLVHAVDLENGNAAVEVAIPNFVPAIFEVSPTASDATLVLRFTTLITNAWYDASAPYHPSAVGVYSDLGRRPDSERSTNRNINIALLYSSYQVLNSLFPARKNDWRNMLLSVDLDPDDDSMDLSTPVGIGNVAGAEVVAARENDGMNQLGNEGARLYHRQPYADYTEFKPDNTAYELSRPSKWQPAIVSDRTGIFRVQQFVTPQLRLTKPYSYNDPNEFQAAFPISSHVWNWWLYITQANDVLEASANLTDEQKMMSELFDNKVSSLALSGLFAGQSQNLSLLEFIQYDFLINMAVYDTAIAIWNEKYRYNAVRPFSAIRFLYGTREVTAWGGVGRGAVDDLPAIQWTSYLPVADHPEYPSASASFCAAQGEVSRLFLGSDTLGYTVTARQGSSRIEPGVTPAVDLQLVFPTWSDFEEKCGQSRFWAGVHFPASIPAGQDIGNEIGKTAYAFLSKKVAGK